MSKCWLTLGALQSTIPAILGAVAKVLNAGEEAAAQEVLENLVEIAEAHPRFLRKQLPDVVTATLQARPDRQDVLSLQHPMSVLHSPKGAALTPALQKLVEMAEAHPEFLHRCQARVQAAAAAQGQFSVPVQPCSRCSRKGLRAAQSLPCLPHRLPTRGTWRPARASWRPSSWSRCAKRARRRPA